MLHALIASEVTDKSLVRYQTHGVHDHTHDALRRGVRYKSQACSVGLDNWGIGKE
jgi:hypothetical protein